MTIDQDIRVVGLDLDGTLLKDDKTISDKTKKTLETAIRRGIYILPATGRTRTAIPECVMDIKGIQYGVCSNGAAVVDLRTGEEFYSCKLRYEDAVELAVRLRGYHTMYDCYIDGKGYTEKKFFSRLDEYKVEPKIQEMIRQSRYPVDDILEVIQEQKRPVEKFNMFFKDLGHREMVYKELAGISHLKVTHSLTNNLEINVAECNKGAALIGFAKKMGFSKGQVMCCGDGNNDYDMIRMCGVGVAMMNGEESVKQAADYITYTNEEDGVASAVERLCFRMQQR